MGNKNELTPDAGDMAFAPGEDSTMPDNDGYAYDLTDQFSAVPDMARPLITAARETMSKIEKMLYASPSFINLVKASVPVQEFQAVLTDEQKARLADGALKLMTKKDGTLMANLVNPDTNRIVSTVSLRSVNLSPAINQAMSGYAMQMQMAQIAEEIQNVQIAIEEVRRGQEYDRLAMAYSCQQKLIQAMKIKDPQLKQMALMQIVSDAEDSRNLLMLSQTTNVAFIMSQPESLVGKFFSRDSYEKINARMGEIRESLGAVNIVSLAEALAYRGMGEDDAALESLRYYASFIKKTYLDDPGIVERLDLIDPSTENYWSKTLPDIQNRIMSLPGLKTELLTGGEDDGEDTENMPGV
jgi:hypothetical protein